MAHTQVNNRCLICGDIISSNSMVYYIVLVKAVDYGIRSGNVLYNPGDIIPVKDGKLRIKHLNSSKRLAHKDCFMRIMSRTDVSPYLEADVVDEN